jgi:protein tyrosine phosphatase
MVDQPLQTHGPHQSPFFSDRSYAKLSGETPFSTQLKSEDFLTDFETPRPLSSLVCPINEHRVYNEFHLLDEISEDKTFVDSFRSYDVYVNICPYKENTIWLSGQVMQAPGYINASPIQTPFCEQPGHMIATQGPIKATIKAFWRMCVQEKVSLVMTVGQQIGHDFDKYFPTSSSEPVKEKGLQVELTTNRRAGLYIDVRTLRVEVDGAEATVQHFHFTGWPDYGVPGEKQKDELFRLLKELARFVVLQQNSPNPMKLVVHCKAGVGRTGTTLAIINAMILYGEYAGKKEETPVSVFSIVRRLREQRMWMCQTPQQYLLIY